LKNIKHKKRAPKKQLKGILLTLFFGPLGLFYCNWQAAIIISIIVLFTTIIYIFIFFIPLLWFWSILISIQSVHHYNEWLKNKKY